MKEVGKEFDILCVKVAEGKATKKDKQRLKTLQKTLLAQCPQPDSTPYWAEQYEKQIEALESLTHYLKKLIDKEKKN